MIGIGLTVLTGAISLLTIFFQERSATSNGSLDILKEKTDKAVVAATNLEIMMRDSII